MKPPPPRFPACGWTTAKAKPVATAASTALPACFHDFHPGARTQFMNTDHNGMRRMDRLRRRRRGSGHGHQHCQQQHD